MIITCPDCAARYDVDDDRFSPNGRSVRCTACGESWYVPAPEPLDIEPIEDLKPVQRTNDKGVGPRRGEKSASRLRVRSFEDEDYRGNETEDDDSLFDEPAPEPASAKPSIPAMEDLPRDSRGRFVSRKKEASAEEPVEKGWRKGKQFIVEEDDAGEVDEEPRRPFFKKRKEAAEDRRDHADDVRRTRREEVREALRFSDLDDEEYDVREEEPHERGSRRRSAAYRDEYDEPYDDGYEGRDELDHEYDRGAEATIVDADFEDVDGARPRGFGRRVRAERRRATAVARMEDVRPFSSDYFDDEFFASLHVTPKELERALRKARRRAESREKTV